MPILRAGFDLAIVLVGAAAWSLAVLVFGSRFLSPTAGDLLALAVFVSALVFVLSGELQAIQGKRLAAGRCPRCHGPVAADHRHRRWDAARSAWLAPTTNWDCPVCAFNHSEAWACPACPEEH